MAYTPKYISLDDVPVQVPDDFDESEKRSALEIAEATIEADLTDGHDVPTEKRSVLFTAAIKQKATCELVKGTEDNDDVAMGDLNDTGDTKVDYAHEAFCDEYDSLVEKMKKTGDWPSAGGSSVNPYVYSTKKPEDER